MDPSLPLYDDIRMGCRLGKQVKDTHFFMIWISWHHRSLFLVLSSRRQDLIAILRSSSYENRKSTEKNIN